MSEGVPTALRLHAGSHGSAAIQYVHFLLPTFFTNHMMSYTPFNSLGRAVKGMAGIDTCLPSLLINGNLILDLISPIDTFFACLVLRLTRYVGTSRPDNSAV